MYKASNTPLSPNSPPPLVGEFALVAQQDTMHSISRPADRQQSATNPKPKPHPLQLKNFPRAADFSETGGGTSVVDTPLKAALQKLEVEYKRSINEFNLIYSECKGPEKASSIHTNFERLKEERGLFISKTRSLMQLRLDTDETFRALPPDYPSVLTTMQDRIAEIECIVKKQPVPSLEQFGPAQQVQAPPLRDLHSVFSMEPDEVAENPVFEAHSEPVLTEYDGVPLAELSAEPMTGDDALRAKKRSYSQQCLDWLCKCFK
jgi:hypothetical protein